jgi:hypothetical protein
VEARSQGRWGEHLEEVNAKRGSAVGVRVTPVRRERTRWVRKPSKSLAGKDSSWQVAEPVVQTTRREGHVEIRARYR